MLHDSGSEHDQRWADRPRLAHTTTQHLILPIFHAPSTFLGYQDVTSFLQAWLPIIFMGLLVVSVFALMRFMPRTRPAADQARVGASDRLGGHRRR